MSQSRPQPCRSAGVVIAGAGLAAQRAAETFRRNGYDGRLRMVSEEPVAPYDRPPLSKEFLAGERDHSTLRFRPDQWYDDHDVELVLGVAAVQLDIQPHDVVLSDGARLRYEQLLIATGSAPRRLPATENYTNVHELRTLAAARGLRDTLLPGTRVIVVGAGFIGQEVAATARRLGAEVTIIAAAASPLAVVLGEQLGGWFAGLHREECIEVLLSTRIARFHGTNTVDEVELDDGRRIACDALVVGIGTEPATAWLRSSGLDERGVLTDAAGRTALPDVFDAGDASPSFDPRLRAHVRTGHWEAARRQGAGAAQAMLGLEVSPARLPSFWSDQHGVRIQYLGHAQGADGLLIDGDPADRDFTATFTQDERPIAALLVGRPQALPALRRQIHEAAQPNDPEREAA